MQRRTSGGAAARRFVAGDRYIGGGELGGVEGEGSALVSEEERKEEALEAVRSASHVS